MYFFIFIFLSACCYIGFEIFYGEYPKSNLKHGSQDKKNVNKDPVVLNEDDLVTFELEATRCFDEYKKAMSSLNFELALKKLNKAIKILESIEKISSNHYYLRAKLKNKLAGPKDALNDLNKAIKIESLPNYFSERAMMKHKLKDFLGAVDDYTQAIERVSKANYFYNRANSKNRLNDFKGAVEDYTKALSMNPDNLNYLTTRGMVLYKLGHTDLSKLDWQNASKKGYKRASNYLIDYFQVHVSMHEAILSTKSLSFLPLTDVKFKIMSSEGRYEWFAIFNYYPINRFSEDELDKIDIEARRHVFDFKDGKQSEYYSDLFASALINKFGREFLQKKTLLVVPASNRQKSQIRFQLFIELLAKRIDAIDGFDFLKNNNREKTPFSVGGNRNEDLAKYILVSESLRDKDVIIIDDVRTSGSSSNQIYRILKNIGVVNVKFIYLAKTVSLQ